MDIAQLVERQIVALEVMGSKPIIHPIEAPERVLLFSHLGFELSLKKKLPVASFLAPA